MAVKVLTVSPIGFGAFKIGRNRGIKYAQGYELPDQAAVDRLLNGVLDLGANYIDTAPAYGLSEERIGHSISHRRAEYVLSTKVGECFADGRSTYDFTKAGVRESVERSLKRLRTDVLDLVFIHSNGDDVGILRETDAAPALLAMRDEGLIRAVGFSGYSADGFGEALRWADAIMVEYHLEERSLEAVIGAATGRGVAVMVKKGLASGKLDAETGIRFVLANPGVTSLVIGGLNLEHFRQNMEVAQCVRGSSAGGDGG